MTETTLFGNPEDADTQTPTPEAPNATDTILAGIVAEDGRQKYDSVEKALHSIPHANAEIIRLKQELEDAQAQANDINGLKELLEKPDVPPENVQTAETPVANGQISEEDIALLVSRTLEQNKAKEQTQTNLENIENALITKFGSQKEANSAFLRKAEELGMTPQALTKLAAEYPSVVSKHFDTSVSPVVPTQPKHTISPTPIEDNTVLKPVGTGATSNDVLQSYRDHTAKYGDKT